MPTFKFEAKLVLQNVKLICFFCSVGVAANWFCKT